MPNIHLLPLGVQSPFIACPVMMEMYPLTFPLCQLTRPSVLSVEGAGGTWQEEGASRFWGAASCSCHSAAKVTFKDIHWCSPHQV